MILKTRNYIANVSNRLGLVRKEHQYSRREMAMRLGITQTNYYKNETAICLPRLDTLRRLHTDFDISMDWLLFGSQPMHNKEKQPVMAVETKPMGLEDKLPDARELLNAMEDDHILMYEILLYFHKYKKNREKNERKPLDEFPAIP